MHVIRNTEEIRKFIGEKKTAVALGAFDGLHRLQRALGVHRQFDDGDSVTDGGFRGAHGDLGASDPRGVDGRGALDRRRRR